MPLHESQKTGVSEYHVQNVCTLISLKYVPMGPALVQVMAWCQTGDKPLPEQMLTQSSDAYMRH